MTTMRSLVRPILALSLALSLAGCVTATEPPAAAAAAAPPAGLCRIGPDDGPLLAERGIGGTGIRPDGLAMGDGGDRGIGGTGIVGVVTGFASICVNGLEVGYDAAIPVDLDGAPGTPGLLRAGHLVVIEAAGPTDSLRARSLALRYEVSGPVEQRRGNEGLRVAGQEIRFTPEMRGGTDWRIGDWVAVSGLRRPDGRIMASRLDRRDPGRVVVRGVAERDGTGMRIGALRFDPPTPLRPGVAVTVTGHVDQDRFIADSVRTDLLQADPARAFSPGIDRLVIDSYFTLSGGLLRLGETSFGSAPRAFGARRAVIDARRGGPGAGFTATEMRGPGEAPGSRGDLRSPGGARSDGAGQRPGGGGPGFQGPRGDRPDGFRGEPGPRGGRAEPGR